LLLRLGLLLRNPIVRTHSCGVVALKTPCCRPLLHHATLHQAPTLLLLGRHHALPLRLQLLQASPLLLRLLPHADAACLLLLLLLRSCRQQLLSNALLLQQAGHVAQVLQEAQGILLLLWLLHARLLLHAERLLHARLTDQPLRLQLLAAAHRSSHALNTKSGEGADVHTYFTA
jgi:hypothetical protein